MVHQNFPSLRRLLPLRDERHCGEVKGAVVFEFNVPNVIVAEQMLQNLLKDSNLGSRLT